MQEHESFLARATSALKLAEYKIHKLPSVDEALWRADKDGMTATEKLAVISKCVADINVYRRQFNLIKFKLETEELDETFHYLREDAERLGATLDNDVEPWSTLIVRADALKKLAPLKVSFRDGRSGAPPARPTGALPPGRPIAPALILDNLAQATIREPIQVMITRKLSPSGDVHASSQIGTQKDLTEEDFGDTGDGEGARSYLTSAESRSKEDSFERGSGSEPEGAM